MIALANLLMRMPGERHKINATVTLSFYLISLLF